MNSRRYFYKVVKQFIHLINSTSLKHRSISIRWLLQSYPKCGYNRHGVWKSFAYCITTASFNSLDETLRHRVMAPLKIKLVNYLGRHKSETTLTSINPFKKTRLFPCNRQIFKDTIDTMLSNTIEMSININDFNNASYGVLRASSVSIAVLHQDLSSVQQAQNFVSLYNISHVTSPSASYSS